MTRHRVVIVGAGFGGLAAARALAKADVDVVVVDRMNHHLFQPLLYQVATALLAPGDIAPALRQVLHRQRNTRVLLGSATELDAQARTVRVELPDRRTEVLHYDSLVVAAGSADSFFGHDEWREHVLPMKTLSDAVQLRSRLLTAFENAANAHDPAERARWLTIAIVGAGPTGVELAGQVAAMARRTLRCQFRDLDPTEARVVLLDAVDTVLPPFAPPLREHTRQTLRKLGVDVELGQLVSDVDAEGVLLKDKNDHEHRLYSRTVVWAAGVRPADFASAVVKATDAETDNKGKIRVTDDCQVPGHPEIFAVGDLANLQDLPGLAAPAMQQGEHAAKVVLARAGLAPAPPPFRYRDRGTMATVSPGDAVADVRGLKLTGLIGKAAWLAVHLAFLVGWRNRGIVLANWAVLLLTGRRAQRVILEAADEGMVRRPS
ncbi:NADH dehydrogenase [Crossiella equi]|uniref:NADH:ubiquinone reductase (non-electrogenic) n=1 Tax=Crossiella equi TaxID=130796 RepID=A0ABS5A5X1_9PSEU|nr:NAD(P)/FAD-dependent oxidoreductase [Crossiella equi]MBP2471609.1 NADH dehydrogenase [Crossiella equi]